MQGAGAWLMALACWGWRLQAPHLTPLRHAPVAPRHQPARPADQPAAACPAPGRRGPLWPPHRALQGAPAQHARRPDAAGRLHGLCRLTSKPCTLNHISEARGAAACPRCVRGRPLLWIPPDMALACSARWHAQHAEASPRGRASAPGPLTVPPAGRRAGPTLGTGACAAGGSGGAACSCAAVVPGSPSAGAASALSPASEPSEEGLSDELLSEVLCRRLGLALTRRLQATRQQAHADAACVSESPTGSTACAQPTSTTKRLVPTLPAQRWPGPSA